MGVWDGRLWDRLRTNFWFVPSVMSAAAVALAVSTVAVDAAVPDALVGDLGWAYRGGPDGAAGVLSTIAGSMVSLAGLVFSMTLVALTLASNQFGPRLLRTFMRDRITQSVLGTFLAAFLYSLFVLRTIRREEGAEFAPHLSVTVAVALAVFSLVALIYFIHHLATSIQADTVIARLADDLAGTVDRLYPEDIGESPPASGPAPEPPATPAGGTAPIRAAGDGYVQAIDGDALLKAAVKYDLTIELVRRPGRYLIAGGPLAVAWPGGRVGPAAEAAVREAVAVGAARTPIQDVEFVIDQLVEVAARALSPGVNDPFTAIACVDRLASGLGRLARRPVPDAVRCGPDGEPRVIARPVRFPAAMDAAFNQVRQLSAATPAVSLRLLEVFADLAGVVTDPADRAAVRRHAEMVERVARRGANEDHDRTDIADRFAAVRRALGDPE